MDEGVEGVVAVEMSHRIAVVACDPRRERTLHLALRRVLWRGGAGHAWPEAGDRVDVFEGLHNRLVVMRGHGLLRRLVLRLAVGFRGLLVGSCHVHSGILAFLRRRWARVAGLLRGMPRGAGIFVRLH